MKKNIDSRFFYFLAMIILIATFSNCKPDNFKSEALPSTGLATIINLDTSFSNFNKAIKISGLSSTINTGEYTVLIPSNLAFNNFLSSNGKKIDDIPSDTLKAIMSYHLLSGDVAMNQYDGKPTLLGVNLNLGGLNSVAYSANARKGKAFIIDKVLIPPAIHSLHQ